MITAVIWRSVVDDYSARVWSEWVELTPVTVMPVAGPTPAGPTVKSTTTSPRELASVI